MSTDAKDNPQVFPIVTKIEGTTYQTVFTREGISLRDWFAGHFFAARLANPNASSDRSDLDMARAAYRRADALLKAREEK